MLSATSLSKKEVGKSSDIPHFGANGGSAAVIAALRITLAARCSTLNRAGAGFALAETAVGGNAPAKPLPRLDNPARKVSERDRSLRRV